MTDDKSEENVSEQENLPDVLPIFGVPMPIFPFAFEPVMLGDENEIAIADEASKYNDCLGIVMIHDAPDHENMSELCGVGTVVKILRRLKLPNGQASIFVSALKRFVIKEIFHSLPNGEGVLLARVEYLEAREKKSPKMRAQVRVLIDEAAKLLTANPVFAEVMRNEFAENNSVDRISYKILDNLSSTLDLSPEETQSLLESTDVEKRVQSLIFYVKREQELSSIQNRVQADINEKIEKNQREHFLREELDAIKEELGMATDAKTRDCETFRKKLDQFEFNDEVKEVVESELEKFALMDPNSSEYFVSRNYLDLISNLPWKRKPADAKKAKSKKAEAAADEKKENSQVETHSHDNYELSSAQKILEADHYGLSDVKKRIVEFLAVRKLKNDKKGAIILLIGPPGVGKTSVGKSIARAMNRPFFRFSVGGLDDDAEIKGHRRTYVGAMPGKILQGLKITKADSPVFMIDEVDKMSRTGHGDPASALLEVLDPEQNVDFRDYYLDLPFDVSNILFILTANTLEGIPEPLLDRAETIHLSGYVDQEKIEIAKKYLIPKSLEKNGLKKHQVKYSAKTILEIAKCYAREAGVRNLEKSFDKIHRKIAVELLTAQGSAAEDSDCEAALQKKFEIQIEDLQKYLGKPEFDESEIKCASIPGTAIGLAWTSMGGDTLLIESIATEASQHRGDFSLTGQLGDVMKESAAIAKKWVEKHLVSQSKIKSSWFDNHCIHLHVPEGATPKDGPSAGITMATAIFSLLTRKKIKPNLAMTGEISLTGQVLQIGGLKEKTVAAKRNKIRQIIIPRANLHDLDEIPEIVKEGIDFFPVSRMEEVLELAF